jgi:hypothetical protein
MSHQSKKKDLVAVLVIVNEEGVGAANVFGKTEACSAAQQMVYKIPGADSGMVV